MAIVAGAALSPGSSEAASARPVTPPKPHILFSAVRNVTPGAGGAGGSGGSGGTTAASSSTNADPSCFLGGGSVSADDEISGTPILVAGDCNCPNPSANEWKRGAFMASSVKELSEKPHPAAFSDFFPALGKEGGLEPSATVLASSSTAATHSRGTAASTAVRSSRRTGSRPRVSRRELWRSRADESESDFSVLVAAQAAGVPGGKRGGGARNARATATAGGGGARGGGGALGHRPPDADDGEDDGDDEGTEPTPLLAPAPAALAAQFSNASESRSPAPRGPGPEGKSDRSGATITPVPTRPIFPASNAGAPAAAAAFGKAASVDGEIQVRRKAGEPTTSRIVRRTNVQRPQSRLARRGSEAANGAGSTGAGSASDASRGWHRRATSRGARRRSGAPTSGAQAPPAASIVPGATSVAGSAGPGPASTGPVCAGFAYIRGGGPGTGLGRPLVPVPPGRSPSRITRMPTAAGVTAASLSARGRSGPLKTQLSALRPFSRDGLRPGAAWALADSGGCAAAPHRRMPLLPLPVFPSNTNHSNRRVAKGAAVGRGAGAARAADAARKPPGVLTITNDTVTLRQAATRLEHEKRMQKDAEAEWLRVRCRILQLETRKRDLVRQARLLDQQATVLARRRMFKEERSKLEKLRATYKEADIVQKRAQAEAVRLAQMHKKKQVRIALEKWRRNRAVEIKKEAIDLRSEREKLLDQDRESARQKKMEINKNRQEAKLRLEAVRKRRKIDALKRVAETAKAHRERIVELRERIALGRLEEEELNSEIEEIESILSEAFQMQIGGAISTSMNK